MDIRDYLRGQRVRFEAILHRPEASASRRAGCVHVPGDRVVKSVLVRSDDRFLLAVLPATCRIDWPKLAELTRSQELRLATEEEVAAIFNDCERGAVPPFGALYGIATVIDASLAAGREVVVEANVRHLDLRLRYNDFERLNAPIRGRFADLVVPRRRAEARPRRAG